ncbi:hypothetical protein PS627_02958 [Pseudomonas fluorescens]|uniref:DUF2796 domain-containing protein n=1 Tax=Pseudomonas fluorescens TaxID=294 RepID=UPI00125C7F7A|nr:DUF2796 domain-containing protein [Pseudomonas fluorescens]CAG8868304.1 hypothetical protein PS627_02958 [Pseudomonas fluorescens]VVQ03613.1 hypothetical protein PS910_04046 [Pseudomonas fluorescens]
MRPLLLALPFALLPLAVAHAHDEHDHDHPHGSLGAHEHGVASLNVALDGNTLELELDTPAMNLVGFEHAASTDADKAKVAVVRQQLEQPLKLFGLAKDAGCSQSAEDLQSPLFGDAQAAGHEHTDIHAHYQITCSQPGKLAQLDLGPLFSAFPATRTINVQLIGPDGQKGTQASPAQAVVAF